MFRDADNDVLVDLLCKREPWETSFCLPFCLTLHLNGLGPICINTQRATLDSPNTALPDRNRMDNAKYITRDADEDIFVDSFLDRLGLIYMNTQKVAVASPPKYKGNIPEVNKAFHSLGLEFYEFLTPPTDNARIYEYQTVKVDYINDRLWLSIANIQYLPIFRRSQSFALRKPKRCK